LRDLRKQCALAEAGVAPSASQAPATNQSATTQAEIVLWKSIENSTNADDFKAYLTQYPNGAFAVLAKSRIDRIEKQQAAAAQAEEQKREEATKAAEHQKFHIPVAHVHPGKECFGYFDISADGAVYSGTTKQGSAEHVQINKSDVKEIKIDCATCADIVFVLKNGNKHSFSQTTDYAVANHKGVSDYGLLRTMPDRIVEKWGWQLSPDKKKLTPP
jgi:hypothetical protein